MVIGVDQNLILVLNILGTFAFAVSGAIAAVRARLDIFGITVLAAVVGLAGGITRDVLIGIPPTSIRDTRFLLVVIFTGILTTYAHRFLKRLYRPILVFDAAGLGLFCVTGSTAALHHGVGPLEAILFGVLTGVGGGVVRDVLLNEVPIVLRSGLYAIPALIGAAIVVSAYELGNYSVIWPILGAFTCIAIRLIGLRYQIDAPRPRTDPSR